MIEDLEMGRGCWLSGWALNVITEALLRGRQESQRRTWDDDGSRSQSDAATSPGAWVASSSQKRQEADPLPELPEGAQPCSHLDSNPVRAVLDF